MAKYSNFVALRGQLAAEPRTRTAGTLELTELRLLITEPKRTNPGQPPEYVSHFFTVACWREQNTEAKTLKKGDQIGVIGKLKHRTWQDKNTGQNREAVDIVADALTISIVPDLPPAQPSFDSMVPQTVPADDGW